MENYENGGKNIHVKRQKSALIDKSCSLSKIVKSIIINKIYENWLFMPKIFVSFYQIAEKRNGFEKNFKNLILGE